MQNQIDYKNGAQITFDTAADVESELLFGKGRAYGLEIIAKRKAENLPDGFPTPFRKRKEKLTALMIMNGIMQEWIKRMIFR